MSDPTENGKNVEEKNGGNEDVPTNSSAIVPDTHAELIKKIQELQLAMSGNRDFSEAKHHNYAFWGTQPVPKLEENVTENTYIEAPIPLDKIRKEPYTLPTGFSWCNVDLLNDDELTELYKLLSDNYVEDDESLFRFDYSKEFFKWALLPPGWKSEWHCGVRASKTNKLLAFIAAVPCKIKVRDAEIDMVEINFLCVHKNLRSKRLTPVLVKEITRRVNLTGIFQAAYTAGVILPKPITTSRYWHRSLNPKKLIECRFSCLGRNMTMQRTIKYYKLRNEPVHKVIRLEKRHLKGAYQLLTNYLSKFLLHPVFSKKEFDHYFLPRDQVIYSYVIEKDNVVTDFISFYSLPSTVVNNSQHKKIVAAYSFYNVATSVSLTELMGDALICAHQDGFDVFNALDLMDNKVFLSDLKFGIGDGNLQYYLYNWKSPEMSPEEELRPALFTLAPA
uniref:Glycylpeptide N-tetradecanoyltransferase n=1 Tax=Bursaphelenchus xylophilus TaxID=6326 RepID=A0A1I7SUF9_BURXY